MIPLIILGLFSLFIFLPKIDPKKKNYIQMGKAYGSITLVIMFVFTLTSLMPSFNLMIAFAITILIMVLIPMVYSFVIFKRLVNGGQ